MFSPNGHSCWSWAGAKPGTRSFWSSACAASVHHLDRLLHSQSCEQGGSAAAQTQPCGCLHRQHPRLWPHVQYHGSSPLTFLWSRNIEAGFDPFILLLRKISWWIYHNLSSYFFLLIDIWIISSIPFFHKLYSSEYCWTYFMQTWEFLYGISGLCAIFIWSLIRYGQITVNTHWREFEYPAVMATTNGHSSLSWTNPKAKFLPGLPCWCRSSKTWIILHWFFKL